MAPTRVLVVYGSETGNVRRGIHECVNAWQSKCDGSYVLSSANVMAGNDVEKEFTSLGELAHNFDVLIVASSSFGEGDPPQNFKKFLLMLVRAANASQKSGRAKPLEGLQHAVMGYGQSLYPTFMSCPRFTDKLLGDLGSRRMVKRVEIDEGPDETIDAGGDDDSKFTAMGSGSGATADDILGRAVPRKGFIVAVHAALIKASATASSPPVCSWSEPAGEYTEKSEEDLLYNRPEIVADEGLPQWLKYALVALMASAVTHFVHNPDQLPSLL